MGDVVVCTGASVVVTACVVVTAFVVVLEVVLEAVVVAIADVVVTAGTSVEVILSVSVCVTVVVSAAVVVFTGSVTETASVDVTEDSIDVVAAVVVTIVVVVVTAVVVTAEGNTVTVTQNEEMDSYENTGAGKTGKWFGLLIDLGAGVDASKVTATSGYSFDSNETDPVHTAKFGGNSQSVILWLTAEDCESGKTIKVKDEDNIERTITVQFVNNYVPPVDPV